MLFDTHAHIFDERFNEDREALIASLPERGLGRVMVPGADMPSSLAMPTFVERHEMLVGSVGVTPHDAKDMTDGDVERLRELAAHPKIVALGEMGLDYHYDFTPRDVQQKRFLEQMDLAAELRLPVILHSRESTGDMMAILKSYAGRVRGVMHCFSGSYETAREALDLGYYISFAGPLTFKNARKVREVAAKLPHDRVTVETDSPYLAPEPKRGGRNEPAYVRHVCAKLAEIWGLSYEETEHLTYENGLRLFNLSE